MNSQPVHRELIFLNAKREGGGRCACIEESRTSRHQSHRPALAKADTAAVKVNTLLQKLLGTGLKPVSSARSPTALSGQSIRQDYGKGDAWSAKAEDGQAT